MLTISVRYCFASELGSEEIFDLTIDTHDLSLLADIPETLPAWTELGFHQCPHCPLKTYTRLRCPLAAHLVDVVRRFDDLVYIEDSLEDIRHLFKHFLVEAPKDKSM
jgi:hypothetical protein